MTIRKSSFVMLLIAAFVAGVLLTFGALVGLYAYTHGVIGSGGASGDSAQISQTKIKEIDSYIDRYYLRDADRKEMVDNAYRGYVAGLDDPYSSYMTKEEYDSFNTQTMGTYSGVGITFEMRKDGSYRVVSVNKDSPAAKAGIKAGDEILEVDGKYYSSSDVMATHIRGKKGTDVTLTILRDGKKKEYTMTREKIEQESVEYEMLDKDTALIRISSFIDSTGTDFINALREAEDQGAKKLVLDLRDNGGGLVDDSITVADQFLDEGVACYVKDKNGVTEEYKVKDGKTDLKTVVLVNGNSASASEILTAALQDNGYEVIGEKTFGKGVIQTAFDLPEGDAVKLTILEYLSPKKHKVHEKGVKPDVKVKDKKSTKEDEQLDKALEELDKM